jgi:hypothetical protein
MDYIEEIGKRRKVYPGRFPRSIGNPAWSGRRLGEDVSDVDGMRVLLTGGVLNVLRRAQGEADRRRWTSRTSRGPAKGTGIYATNQVGGGA